jgi:sugar transferase (PEP-CTERM/EpsH1 system associated)
MILMQNTVERRVKIAHIVYRLDFGGMENGVINLINGLPGDEFSHTVICLTYASRFGDRIRSKDVQVVELNKPEGNHLPTYWKVLRVLRDLRPDIVHSRNLGTLDLCLVSKLAGVAIHIHGEHGWSAHDISGASVRHKFLRRAVNPLISRYLAVSDDISRWLTDAIGLPGDKISVIHNGVDVNRFSAPEGTDDSSVHCSEKVVLGTIGRQDLVKGLDYFVGALEVLFRTRPELRSAVRVVIGGDGEEHDRIAALCDKAIFDGIVELPGIIEDVPAFMRELDFLVQPSLNEGISNTVLEAMASGIPVIATNVGGNPELIRPGVDGLLIPPRDIGSLCESIKYYIENQYVRQQHGRAAGDRARSTFSLPAMIENYRQFYSSVAA